MFDLFCHPSGRDDRLGCAGDRALGVGIRKEDTIYRLTKEWLYLREQSRCGHVHGMSSAVEVHFDRINVEGREQFLEIPKYIACDPAGCGLGEQKSTLFFLQRRVAAEDVVSRMKVGLIANHPIGHDEVSE